MSRDDVVFDSSVLLAYLLNEAGSEILAFVIDRAVMSAVNLAEVRTRLEDLGAKAQASGNLALQLIRRIEPFDEADAVATADLRKKTSFAGLSLGDRACLALALKLGADVYTADRHWATVQVGCRIHMIR